jgi:hypothetical protein
MFSRNHPLNSVLSESLQKGQELVWWTIPSRPAPERLSFGECLFLQFKIGMKVDLRGVHGACPSHKAMTERSTPCCSRFIAVL